MVIINRRMQATPEIMEFLETATPLEESRNREIRDMVYTNRDGTLMFNVNTWRWIHPYIDKGYSYVDLLPTGETKAKSYRVNRLIARIYCWRPFIFADIRKPWRQLDVHHINHCTLDNRPENLEIIDPRYHRKLHHSKDTEVNLIFCGEDEVV